MTASVSTSRFRITPLEGDPYVVRCRQTDFIAWDKTAPRMQWGTSRDVPFLFSSFIAWNAARREGMFPGSFDAFCDSVSDLDPLRDDDEDDTARPTQRAASPVS